jgi:hypothetical protein
MKYKKFILFLYDQYYPGGGLSDIDDSFDTLEEAKAAALKRYRDFREIVDRDTWEIVWSEWL